MMGRAAETAPEGGGHGDGLPGSSTEAFTQGGRGQDAARERPDVLFFDPKVPLRASRRAIQSLQEPTVVGGKALLRKSRCKGIIHEPITQ